MPQTEPVPTFLKMFFSPICMLGNDTVHEVQKHDTAAALVMARSALAARPNSGSKVRR
jgi:hypothetical protein